MNRWISDLRALAERESTAPYDAQIIRQVVRLFTKDPARVVIETPYAGDVERNEAYAKRAMYDSLRRGEAPFLSHLLYTMVLCDDVEADRKLGIDAGLTWGGVSSFTAVYDDYGVTDGMWEGIERAKAEGRRVVIRRIGENPEALAA